MTIKNMLLTLLVAVLVGCGNVPRTEAPELSRSDAAKLLAELGHSNVTIVAVVNGIRAQEMGLMSSPNVATVYFVSDRPMQMEQYFFYDKEIGWFYLEQSYEGGRHIRLWTTAGYKEIKP